MCFNVPASSFPRMIPAGLPVPEDRKRSRSGAPAPLRPFRPWPERCGQNRSCWTHPAGRRGPRVVLRQGDGEDRRGHVRGRAEGRGREGRGDGRAACGVLPHHLQRRGAGPASRRHAVDDDERGQSREVRARVRQRGAGRRPDPARIAHDAGVVRAPARLGARHGPSLDACEAAERRRRREGRAARPFRARRRSRRGSGSFR